MPTMGLDADGDVDMTVPQPIYEFVKAPRLEGWSQSAVAVYLRERKRYEEKIAERCAVTGEAVENVTTSIKTSLKVSVLDYVAKHVIKRNVALVTDEELRQRMQLKVATMMNDHLPDIEQLFARELKMDLRERDISARIADYYILFDKIVEDNGLKAILSGDQAIDEDGKQRMKLRCKLLVRHVAPEALRIELTRLIEHTHRTAKFDDDILHDLMVDRALRQQQSHLLQQELKQGKSVKGTGKRGADAPATSGGGKAAEGKSARKAEGTTTPAVRDPPRTGCFLCQGNHWAKDCPTATDEQKDELARRLAEKRGKGDKMKRVTRPTVTDRRTVVLNGVLETPFCPDTGAEVNIVGRQVVEELRALDSRVELAKLDPPKPVKAAGGTIMYCHESVVLDLRIETAAGPVHLNAIECLVLDADEDELLLGAPTLASIGIDVDRMIEQLAKRNHAQEDAAVDDIPEDLVEVLGQNDDEELQLALNSLIGDAIANGFELPLVEDMRSLVTEFADVFRVRIGADPPAKIEPLKVRLREGAVPHRAGVRRYPEAQRVFLRGYVKDLERAGLIRRNNNSRWACAALPVKKHDGGYRMAVDYRPVNRETVPIAGTTPNLAVIAEEVRGAYGLGLFDLLKGFWQAALAEDSQEYFSFVTEDGIYTPTRVPQGAADSAMHFQGQMNECFRDMLHEGLLVYIDDLLLYARSAEEYLINLRRFFTILRDRGLKLNVKKCTLFAKRVVWCGKVIDGQGLAHDPSRLDALRQMPLPPTGAALQHFLCALNWLRDSMVDYARTTAPLYSKLEAIMVERGRRKAQLRGAQLDWDHAETEAFKAVLAMVVRACKLSFPDAEAILCVFTDASNTGWSQVITQVANWDEKQPVELQQHELVLCRSGMFKGAQLNWSVIEREAYPLVKACSELGYMLDRKLGFRVYCDHSNLIKIFAPSEEVKQHVKSKLQRWVLQMVNYRYSIYHIAGESNLWADIVSRWGQPQSVELRAIKRVTTRATMQVSAIRPLQDDNFQWPDRAAIRQAQLSYRDDAPSDGEERDGLIVVDGRPWVPSQARELIQRLFIVAHCGVGCHRGVHVMVEQIERHFSLDGLRARVLRFINACLLCKHVKGGKLIQRNWTVERSVTKRNECLHMDYLYLGDSYGKTKYILVLKDELTHYCELVPADTADGATVATAMLDWHKRFGMPETWISDNNTHFKNSVLEELTSRFSVLHTFVPVYTPWINGTVERVNRDILQVLRAMLLEYHLDTRNWVYLLPLIQANLNHTPVVSLGSCAPIELFTGMPAPSQLDVIVPGVERVSRELPVATEALRSAVDRLRTSLQRLHKVAVDRHEQQRLAAMARSKGGECNFSIGDYVLWSRIDKRIRGNKLLGRWIGPFRVMEALPHSFIIQHLISGARYDVHGSRLKFYSDTDFEVTAEVREHVSLQGIVLEVRELVGHRFNQTSGEWELHVAWKGLQDIENSWEPFASMLRDVPTLVRRYVHEHNVAELDQLL